MSGYPHYPIKIEKDEETGALRYTATVNLLEEYMRMIDRRIAEQGEAAMDAALEAHGYTKERIVRCKDCKHFTESMAWPGAHECDFINRGVESDGYCAWGERREAWMQSQSSTTGIGSPCSRLSNRCPEGNAPSCASRSGSGGRS